MKRMMLLALVAASVASSTGCCLIDRIFCCRRGYPMPASSCGAGCGGCGACSGAGACGNCGPGGMGGCENCGPGGAGGYGDGSGYGDGGYGDGSGGGGYGDMYGGGPGGPGGAGGRGRGAGLLDRLQADRASKYAGPETAQVAYPYYTNRGPRDFLAKNPRSIGP